MNNRWKTALLSALLISSLGNYTIRAEQGTTTYTHIHREEITDTHTTETMRTETYKSEIKPGASTALPDWDPDPFSTEADKMFPKKKAYPSIDLRRTPPAQGLPAYKAIAAEEDAHFYDHGILAIVQNGKQWGIVDLQGK